VIMVVRRKKRKRRFLGTRRWVGGNHMETYKIEGDNVEEHRQDSLKIER